MASKVIVPDLGSDNEIDVSVGGRGNRGKQKGKISVAKDAVSKRTSDGGNGGSWVVVAETVSVNIHFNF
ncbi:p7 protein [Pelargonium flower break virus]|uniref:Movement protein 1 n=1 Tax=Pelargonium flower break virus TaxID=35291 RepID=Q70WT9_9TOMB|nr:p7 protein [Pelargonium flower break virus]ABD93211.1 putative movement protein [Pelargonium flower break virus]ABD93214.1 putative movement protein [Pelargonium flower break virus]ABD93217.1 putative movement protein [Pelargonium flower break virus]ABD93220.1 putative movement protein [Pelargonium flower break virus]ABD93223.1 putative movement protein [Pelargonium flower break virus]